MTADNLKIDSYRIPVVVSTLDILEILRDASDPVSARDIALMTQTSRSTVYRILKTLVWRGYVCQGVYGKFSLAPSSWSRVDPRMRESELNSRIKTIFETSDISKQETVDVLLEVLQSVMQSTLSPKTRSQDGDRRMRIPLESRWSKPTDPNRTV